MIELAQHIETLLLENDCVIVPGLGGFVGHYIPASHVAEENRFLPPVRVIGFNSSLKMNDGLFVQSYASIYGTSFSDATRRIEIQVNKLLDRLHQEGKVELPNIGELHYSIYGTFSFTPYDHKLTTPYLYGISSFEMPQLNLPKQTANSLRRIVPPPAKPISHRQRRRLHAELSMTTFHVRNVMGAVAALILFFLISTPIENTGVIEENYAHLMPGELFSQLRQTSMITTPVNFKKNQDKTIKTKEVKVKELEKKSNTATLENITPKPVHIATSKPVITQEKAGRKEKSATPKPTSEVKTAKLYHIIVASVSTELDARRMAEQLQRSGYTKACAVIGNGKMRVSIQSFTNQAEAYKGLKSIRAIEPYQSAWILH